MRRLRLTIRRLMIAVAVLAFPLGVAAERRARFTRIAAHHQAESFDIFRRSPYAHFGDYSEAVNRRLDWHELMRLRYEHAARYPWLRVAPDLPEPE